MADTSLDVGSILDRLIRRYAAVLEAQDDDNIKIGDFLKLVEIRNKLAPDDTTQAQFWSHLDQVRKKELTPKKKTASRKKTTTKKKQKPEQSE